MILIRLCIVLAVIAVTTPVPAPVSAQEEDLRPRAYVGRYIQLDPIMVPFQTSRGLRYEVVTIRLVIGKNSTARFACFSAPKLHEKLLFFLWERGLTAQEFAGERQDGLAAEMLKFVSDETDPDYYAAVELAGGYDEIDEDSQSLSNLCK